MVAPLSHTHVLSGRHPVRGATVVPCQPPAEDGLAAIVAIRRDRGGQRGFLPRQGEGPHFAHMRQVICFTWQGIGLHAPGLAPKIWVGSKLGICHDVRYRPCPPPQKGDEKGSVAVVGLGLEGPG